MKFIKRLLSSVLAMAMALSIAITPCYASIFDGSSIADGDDRYTVTSTSGKNLSICKMIITYDDGSTGLGGTGFLVNSTKVITAAHCLRTLKSSGSGYKTASSITFSFGASGSNNSHTATYTRTEDVTMDSNMFVPDNWKTSISNGSYNKSYDYGYVTLSTAVNTGNYFSVSTSVSEGDTIYITGYENHFKATDYSNWTLLQSSGQVVSRSSRSFTTRAESMPGQSGSPVTNSSGTVVGILTYGANEGDWVNTTTYPNAYNTVTRIDSTAKGFLGI